MSAAKAEKPTTVEDYTHPYWCDLAKCEPGSGGQGKSAGVHYSTGLVWTVQADEAEFLIELIRSDDYHAHTGENAAPTQLKLTLQQMVSDTDDPRAGCYADAWVDVADARLLAMFLNRYADMAERSNRPIRQDLPVSELPQRKRTF